MRPYWPFSLSLPAPLDHGDIMAAEIRLFPCLTDNFGYLIHDPVTKATASIDAPEAAPVIKALEREGWTLTDILITHHHADHVGGVAELKQKYRCRVLAPHDKSAGIADVDTRVAHGDVVKVGGLLVRVLETPGHTLDHVSYVFDSEKALFAADTLFSIGCGRVFEGTYPQMWDSLLKLRALPDDFKLYCGHEYTAANVKFALTIEPDNAALKARAEEVTRLRVAGQPTIPVTLGEEKKANVFLRADEPSVAASVRMKGASGAQVFGELRERKNKS
jgi:hydroxyacylglutathione hydrolase